MLKKIAMILALAIPATATADRVYDIKAVGAAEVQDPEGMGYYRSCRATKRMLKDHHVLRISIDGTITIDGFKWRQFTLEPDLFIDFHAERGQKTSLEMELYINQKGLSGKYYLWGVTPDEGKVENQLLCVDAVYVEGTRR